MARSIVWICIKSLVALIMAWAGYIVGMVLAIDYLGDHGDVGSAFMAAITVPIGVALGASLGWFGVRRAERKLAAKTN
jgi:hypothetical protein